MAVTNRSTGPNKTKNSDPTWSSLKLTRLVGLDNGDFRLLKDDRSSLLGDIRIVMGDVEYKLDRAILASKSNYLKNLILPLKENDIVNEMNYVKPTDISLNRHILDIIYDITNVECVINEENFAKLLNYMQIFKMEVDLDIFKQFIEEIVVPKEQLNIHMFELLNFLLKNSPDFNYLMPIVIQDLSNRLTQIYEEKEFFSLSAEAFILILLRKSDDDDHLEKHLVSRVCAEWICHEYQNRIEKLKDLVNATKYRYAFLPYCHREPIMTIKSRQKTHLSTEPNVSLVEKYFNELLLSHGETKLDTPSELTTNTLNSMQPGNRVVFQTNQTAQWVSFLKDEIFCDVAVIVQGTTFKLHRIKLSSVSGYFYDLFTNSTESVDSEVDKSGDESKIRTHVLDQINSETFRSVVQYIYRQKIEVTSVNQLISILKASEFLKMTALFDVCCDELLDVANLDLSANIFEMFQYAGENVKYISETYGLIRKAVIRLWPKLDEIPQFLNISLDTLTKIVALPELEIDNTDQVLDLCSKWIFFDVQNRYKCIVEVAKAINRNFMMDTEQLELEIPQNPIDFSQQYVKQQLIRILSSTVLVPAKLKNIQKVGPKPCFLALSKNHSLCILDSNFNEIIHLSQVNDHRFFSSSATLNDNELFILYRDDHFRFYFQCYDISSNKMITLASDYRMSHLKNFVLLSCNDEVYFCNDDVILKYSLELNRWITFLKFDDGSEKQYTSDGENLFKISSRHNEEEETTSSQYNEETTSNQYNEEPTSNQYNEEAPSNQYNEEITSNQYDEETTSSYQYDEETTEWLNETSYYDFEHNEWIALPNIPIEAESIMTKGKASIIKGELSFLFKSETFSFNWVTQKWISASNLHENFIEFTADGKNILYVSDANEVYLYSPVRNKWTLKEKLDVFGLVRTIHKIDR